MKCTECGGAGFFLGLNGFFTVCLHCDGTGEVQTNEEWFDGLSAEEKAKELQLIYISGRTDEFYDKPQKTVRKFIQWLKQPHTDKE